MTQLTIAGLRLAYGEREVLHGIDFELGPGERAALLGPNGAGKSSVLRCLSGLVRPSGGSIRLDGVPIGEFSRATLARQIAVVPGQAAIAFSMPVEDAVALGRVPHEHPLLGARPADHSAVIGAIERVGIGNLVGRDVRQLSLGERQLVVLAMTIAQGAALLLLDEPTVHLDLRHQVRVMELMRELAEVDGVTVLSVLHDVSMARHFFDRLMLLDQGRLVGDGRPTDVLTEGTIRGVYGVDPMLVGVTAS